jgi:hypothetical protein
MEADAREEFVQRAGYVSREMPAVAAFAGAETGRAAALLGETSADEGSAWQGEGHQAYRDTGVLHDGLLDLVDELPSSSVVT